MLNNHELKAQIFGSMCSKDWVAQCYSEYLDSCVSEYSNLTNMVSAAITTDIDDDTNVVTTMRSRDTVETSVNAIQQFANSVRELVEGEAEIEGVDLSTISVDSDAYDGILRNVVAHEDFTNLVSVFTGGNTEAIGALTSNLKAYVLGRVSDLPDAIRNVFPSLSTLSEVFQTRVESAYASLKNEFGITNDDSLVTLPKGYVHVKEFIKGIIAAGNDDFQGTDPIIGGLNLKDAFNSVVTSFSSSDLCLSNIGEFMNSTLESVSASAAGFKAAAKDAVSDRLATFDAYIQGVKGSLSDSTRSFIANIKNKLTESSSTLGNFFDWFGTNLGFMNDEEPATTPPLILEDQDFYAYTGCSPTAAMDWQISVNLDAVGAFFVSIWNGLCDAYNALAAWVQKTITNIGSSIIDTFVDPYDVDVLDGSESGLFENFQWQGTNSITVGDDGSGLYTELVSDMIEASNGLNNSWIKFKTVFGEVMFRITEVSDHTSYATINYQWIIKPRPVNGQLLTEFIASYTGSDSSYDPVITDGSTVTWRGLTPGATSSRVSTCITAFKDMLQAVQDMLSNGTLFLNKDSVPEFDLYSGLAMSMLMLLRTMYFGGMEVLASVFGLDVVDPAGSYSSIFFDNSLTYDAGMTFTWVPVVNETAPGALDPITNLDWIKLACGLKERQGSDPVYNDASVLTARALPANTVIGQSDVEGAISAFIQAFIIQQTDKLRDPGNYLFIPYSKNRTNFSDPQYRIRTDAENGKRASHFIMTAIVVTIVAVAVITLTPKILSLRRRAFFKRAEFIGQMDNCMWSGTADARKEWLTDANMRKYVRFTKRNARSRLLDAAVGGGISALGSTIDNVAAKADVIYRSATGSDSSPLAPILHSADDIEAITSTVIRLITGR